jgi:hypothetical protein
VAPLLLIEPEADRELEEAVSRYDEERSGLGQRFLAEVSASLEQILQFPLAGAPVPHVPAELPIRRAPVKGFPFQIVYLTTTEAVRVLACAHYRRRPGYWLVRVGL